MANNQDNPGIRVPPPLIYLLPLLLGLLLDKLSHVPFLPRGVARIIGWPLIGSGVLLGGWFRRTMRSADAPMRTDKPVPRLVQNGPFSYTPKEAPGSRQEVIREYQDNRYPSLSGSSPSSFSEEIAPLDTPGLSVKI